VRVFLPKCWFDAEKCARGIDALKLYRAEYDDKLQALRPRPVRLPCCPKCLFMDAKRDVSTA
jgi:hypothetical protein